LTDDSGLYLPVIEKLLSFAERGIASESLVGGEEGTDPQSGGEYPKLFGCRV
jgi:hypothetical protein